ncbi:related to CTK2 Carboxy-terminal domain (CTD) kinase, beta subunit [Rhynchosporium agropyri]|uniref:RNA polymerase II holoenzyme cyclin-like subunit n=1 Tax=Rhynchosporium agropyri TaxID=914238 RepID=A0A1E1L2J6_9HELO|nr:related to CTK2 Carboxy-terminal domain (CTD) kinase, beta subunit [Rhynchosporium agropyri]
MSSTVGLTQAQLRALRGRKPTSPATIKYEFVPQSFPPSTSYTSSTSSSIRTPIADIEGAPVYQAHRFGPYSQPYQMAPAVMVLNPTGPPLSQINVSQVFLFQQQLQNQMMVIGSNPTREDTYRLQGVQWINDVRTALQLPVRTFCTAAHYYHKFRLVHRDNEYQFQDAAAAALLTACKIEDTLKKSREILCAAHNIKVAPADHLSPDDIAFETPSKIIIGLERLMLEASDFDFRVRYPHVHLFKLANEAGIEKDVARVAYNMMIDLYRTFAPLKQTCSTMAFACMELATLLLEKQQTAIRGERSPKYRKWHTSRNEILETILDLLDLYTNWPKQSIVGVGYNVEQFNQLRIPINKEMEDSSLKRYTEQHEIRRVNGLRTNVKTPKTPATPASPIDARTNGRDVNSPATLSPRSSGSGRRGTGHKGQDGTVRFMLDTDQAKRENEITATFSKVEYEEYEIEVEEPIEPKREERPSGPRHDQHQRNGFGRGNGFDRGGGGFDRGGYYHNKRARR